MTRKNAAKTGPSEADVAEAVATLQAELSANAEAIGAILNSEDEPTVAVESEPDYDVETFDFVRDGQVIGATVEIREDGRLVHARHLLNYSHENARTEVVENWLASRVLVTV